MSAQLPALAWGYTKAHEQNASPKRPMHPADQARELARFRAALESIERGQAPTLEDWRLCSDVVNMLETLKAMGEIADEHGLIGDAIAALVDAGERHLAGKGIRLSAPGILAVRGLIEGYAFALEHLAHRTIIKAHRRTNERVQRLVRAVPPGSGVLSL